MKKDECYTHLHAAVCWKKFETGTIVPRPGKSINKLLDSHLHVCDILKSLHQVPGFQRNASPDSRWRIKKFEGGKLSTWFKVVNKCH
jgi:hypothetical protein